jgi:branched-chain amino acid transport system permease protein
MKVSNSRSAPIELEEQSQRRPGRIAMRVMRYRWWFGGGLLVIVLALLLLGPTYLSLYNLSLAFTLFDLMVLALSWNLIGGYGGQFSLGHALFVGAGSYTIAVLLLHTGIPLFLTILLSGGMAALLAFLSALLLLRLRNAYFTVGSLGLAQAALSWMINWSYTGQTQELSLPATATLDYSTLYYLSLALLIVTIVCLVLLIRSPFGLRLMAVRDDEEAAIEHGVNSFFVKMIAFTVSAFFVGIAGALIALQNFSIEPYSAFNTNWTINMIIMTIIGGIATTTGPLVGAVIIFALQQQFQSNSWSTLVIGVLLVSMIRLAPQGLWVLFRQGVQRLIARQSAPLLEQGEHI